MKKTTSFLRRISLPRHVLVLIATCVLLPLFLACVLARPISRRFIYRGAGEASSMLPSAPPTESLDPMIECTATAKDGSRVRMLSLAAVTADDVQQTVVLFHNNRETAEEQERVARSISRRGYSVLVVEYRGYGRSFDVAGSSPTEDGLYSDAEAALEYLRVDRNVPKDRMVIMGTSLGSGVAAEMAARGYGSRLVLITPYTSIPDLVTNTVPILPASLLLGDHFNTLSKAPAIRIPTLIVHGDADEIVPFAMGEKLARAIAHARLLPIEGGHHGDLFLRRGESLVDEIAAFIRSH